MIKGVDEIFDKGISLLIREQAADGSFPSLSSPFVDNFSQAKKFHSVFSTSLILSSLSSLKSETRLDQIKKKATSFLLKQKSNHWSFNYWARDSKEYKSMPYPDDLDDTFCALSALFRYDSNLIDGEAIAKIVSMLTNFEDKEGGPYRTWLVDGGADKAWKDVDLAVNINIAYFLSLQEIELPNLNKFIDSRIEKGQVSSPYYPAFYPLIYFLSRFYKGKGVNKLRKILLSKIKRKDLWGNPFNLVLVVTSLLNLGVSSGQLDEAAAYLFRLGQDAWKPYGFCFDPAINGKAYFSGSQSLTCTFYLEALAKFQQSVKIKKTGKSLYVSHNSEQKIYRGVLNAIKKRFSLLEYTLRIQAQKALQKTLKGDKDKQIILMPYFFKKSIGQRGENITDSFLIKLGLANLYGWIAYTIYDDFLDQEGEPRSLSAANLCLRELTTVYNELLPETGFKSVFAALMDQIDNANTWEVTYCRIIAQKGRFNFENYKYLSDKSIGHALGPLAIIFSLGFNEKSKEVKSLVEFFRHYLIARQLNDDAHDWEKDLKMGHINSASALLLKKAGNIYDFEKLREKFWYETIMEICNLIFDHIDKAKEALNECSLIVDQSLFDNLLSRYQKAAELALKERMQTIKFLKVYKSKTLRLQINT